MAYAPKKWTLLPDGPICGCDQTCAFRHREPLIEIVAQSVCPPSPKYPITADSRVLRSGGLRDPASPSAADSSLGRGRNTAGACSGKGHRISGADAAKEPRNRRLDDSVALGFGARRSGHRDYGRLLPSPHRLLVFSATGPKCWSCWNPFADTGSGCKRCCCSPEFSRPAAAHGWQFGSGNTVPDGNRVPDLGTKKSGAPRTIAAPLPEYKTRLRSVSL